MNLTDIKWSDALDGVGSLVTLFNPAVGGSIKLVSNAVDKLTDDDSTLENQTLGLSGMTAVLDTCINGNLGVDEIKSHLTVINENLKGVENLLNLVQKIMK